MTITVKQLTTYLRASDVPYFNDEMDRLASLLQNYQFWLAAEKDANDDLALCIKLKPGDWQREQANRRASHARMMQRSIKAELRAFLDGCALYDSDPDPELAQRRVEQYRIVLTQLLRHDATLVLPTIEELVPLETINYTVNGARA